MDFKDTINKINDDINTACLKSGRSFKDVTLIGITKHKRAEDIISTFKLGLTHFGESYVQEAIPKIEEVKNTLGSEFSKITWHMVGKLQTNKIKYLKNNFNYLHSIDNERQIDELIKRSENTPQILIEVNTGAETNKGGVDLDGAKRLVEYTLKKESKIKICGLMCIPPDVDNATNKEDARPFFKKLRTYLDILNNEYKIHMTELSMGMSNDFEVAVQEGATMLRIGTLIYGSRY